MIEKIYKWRLNCETHGLVYNYTEDETTPPKCPHDENHVITSGSEIVLDQLSKNIQETKIALNQGGLKKTDEGSVFDAIAGQTTIHQFKLPRKIFIKEGYLVSDNNVVKDQVWMSLLDKDYIHKGILYPAQVDDGQGNMIPIETATANQGVNLHTYINGVPVKKDGNTTSVNEALTELDCKDLYIEIKYKSTGAQDVACGVGVLGYS